MGTITQAGSTKKRLVWAKLTLVLGVAALLPGVGLAPALAALALGILARVLTARKPARYGGKGLLTAGMVVALVGAALFFLEAHAFFTWKIRQADEARKIMTEYRMGAVTYAMEKYREATGRYPKASSMKQLSDILVPGFAASLPQLDGWGRRFSVHSNGNTFTLISRPPPRNGLTPKPLIDHALYPLAAGTRSGPDPPRPDPMPPGGG